MTKNLIEFLLPSHYKRPTRLYIHHGLFKFLVLRPKNNWQAKGHGFQGIVDARPKTTTNVSNRRIAVLGREHADVVDDQYATIGMFFKLKLRVTNALDTKFLFNLLQVASSDFVGRYDQFPTLAQFLIFP